MQRLVDLYIVFQLVKKLTTPFNKTDAFKRGIIDAKGNVLRPYKTLTDPKDKAAWTWLDILMNNLKRLLAKIPGGQSAFFTYTMAFWLLKEPITKLQKASRFNESQLSEAVLGASADKYLTEATVLTEQLSALSADIGKGQTGETRNQPSDMFAGRRVFSVDSATFHRCRLGKRKHARYEEYVGNGPSGQAIREYGRSRHGRRGIILVDETTGAMLYLRHPGNYQLSK